MSTENTDLQKHLVLFVDDEDKTRKYFKRLFGDTFRIIIASDGIEALQVLKENLAEVGVIVTDQKMPNETGVAFLEKAVALKPSLVRILSTAYADIEAAIDAVNKGGVYRYVTKPWDVADFEVTLRRAMEYYILQNERDDLVRQKVTSIESLAISDRVISLAALAATREAKLRHVSEGLMTLVQLHSAASARRSGRISLQRMSWQDLYRRHHAFLSKAVALLPGDISSGPALDVDANIAGSAVIQDAVGSDAKFGIEAASANGSRLPGPQAQVVALVQGILHSIRDVLQPDHRIRVLDKGTGIEVLFPIEAIGPVLDPLFEDAAGVPTDAAFKMTAAFLRYAHAGGTVEVLPQANGQDMRIRLGFSVDRINSGGDSLAAIAGDLIGNELFWSRNQG
jgi:FixJ family two-component response regulator